MLISSFSLEALGLQNIVIVIHAKTIFLIRLSIKGFTLLSPYGGIRFTTQYTVKALLPFWLLYHKKDRALKQIY